MDESAMMILFVSYALLVFVTKLTNKRPDCSIKKMKLS